MSLPWSPPLKVEQDCLNSWLITDSLGVVVASFTSDEDDVTTEEMAIGRKLVELANR